MPSHERTAVINSPMPNGYGFLKKGDAYRTALCRRLTHESGKTLYVVTTGRKVIGLRAPKSIISQVFEKDKSTKKNRRAAVAKRDEAMEGEFKRAVLAQFPEIPEASLQKVLEQAMKKSSGRVGRTGKLALERKAALAVGAHVRHCCTDYDDMVRHQGVGRDEAREQVRSKLFEVLEKWRGSGAAAKPEIGKAGSKNETTSQVQEIRKNRETRRVSPTDNKRSRVRSGQQNIDLPIRTIEASKKSTPAKQTRGNPGQQSRRSQIGSTHATRQSGLDIESFTDDFFDDTDSGDDDHGSILISSDDRPDFDDDWDDGRDEAGAIVISSDDSDG